MSASAAPFSPEDVMATIRWALDMPPEFTLADMLAAFTDALEHCRAKIRACPECGSEARGYCGKHQADADHVLPYLELHETFARASSNPAELAHITRAIRHRPTPEERILAALNGGPT